MRLFHEAVGAGDRGDGMNSFAVEPAATCPSDINTINLTFLSAGQVAERPIAKDFNPSLPNRLATIVKCSLLTAMLLPGLTAAAQNNPALPKLSEARPLKLPNVIQKELPNGLKIVLLEDHSQPAIWLRLAISAGTIRDPRGKIGLAQMTAELLDKGTAARSESQIADTVDGLGASLGAGASEDYLTVSASGLSVHTDTLFTLMADITLNPTFLQPEIERARTRTLNAVTSSLSEPATLANAAIDRLIYGAHPYGDFSTGTSATLPGLTRDDIVQFHSAYFAPNGSTLFIAGDIKPDKALKLAEDAFGAWKRKPLPPLPAPPAAPAASGDKPQITILDRPGAAQTEIRIGALTNGYTDPNRTTASVATAVLGLGQFEGRLTKEIRVKRGLTYGAASFFSRHAQGGEFQISTFTKNQSTGEVVKIALEEARKLRAENTPEDELQDRKDFLNGSFAVSVATLPGVLSRLTTSVLLGKGPEELTTYVSRVQAVTPSQIKDVMTELPLGHPQVVLVGDAKEIEAQVSGLGVVTKIASDSVDLQSPTLQSPKATPPTGGGAQGSPEALAGGKARLAAAVKAHGGDAFVNVKSIILKGTGQLSPPGQDLKLPVDSATLTFMPGGKSRFELKTAFADISLGSPGGGAGWVSFAGNVQDIPNVPGDPTELLRVAAQKGYAVTALPDVENGKPLMSDDNKALEGFSITDDRGAVTNLYVQKDTHLARRLSRKSAQGELIILLGDYHAASGVSLPGSIQIVQGGKTFLDLKLNSFEVNKAVSDDLFARPK